jgi:hypothetical protein
MISTSPKLLQNSKNMTMDNIKECNCEGNWAIKEGK